MEKEDIKYKELQERNNFLEGRVRGYEYLSDLYKKTRLENKQKEKEVEALKKAIQELSGGVLTGSVVLSATKECSAVLKRGDDVSASSEQGMLSIEANGAIGKEGDGNKGIAQAPPGSGSKAQIYDTTTTNHHMDRNSISCNEHHGNRRSGDEQEEYRGERFDEKQSRSNPGEPCAMHHNHNGSAYSELAQQLSPLDGTKKNINGTRKLNGKAERPASNGTPGPVPACRDVFTENAEVESRSIGLSFNPVSEPDTTTPMSPGGSKSSGSSFTVISSTASSRKPSESERQPVLPSSVPGDFSFVHVPAQCAAGGGPGDTAAEWRATDEGRKTRDDTKLSRQPNSNDANANGDMPVATAELMAVKDIFGNQDKVKMERRNLKDIFGNQDEKKMERRNLKEIFGNQDGVKMERGNQKDIFGNQDEKKMEREKQLKAPESTASMLSANGFFISEEQERQLVEDMDEDESLDVEAARNALLRAAGIGSVAMDSDLALQISKDAIKVMKMEKEHQFMKGLIDSQAQEIKKKNEMIKKLEEELQHLREQREQRLAEGGESVSGPPISGFSEEAPTSFGPRPPPPAEKLMVRSQLAGEGADWVSVEKKDKLKEMNALLQQKDQEITSLNKTVDKQGKRLTKLLEANAAWDRHCGQLEAEHAAEVQRVLEDRRRLRQQLADATARLQDSAQGDAMVAGAEERARAAEERARAAEARAEELQQRLHDMQDIIDALNSSVRSIRMSSMNPMPQNGHGGVRGGGGGGVQHMSHSELVTQVQVLQQQVTVCAEDFEREREDRARAQSAKEQLATRLRDAQDALRRAEESLEHMEREKNNLARMLEQKTTEYNLLERQLHNPPAPPARPPAAHHQHIGGQPQASAQHRAPQHRAPQAPGAPPRYTEQVEPPPSYRTTYTPGAGAEVPPVVQPGGGAVRASAPQHTAPAQQQQQQSWSCPVCTFVNPGSRSACEMCEQPRGVHHNHAFLPDAPSLNQ